MRLLLLVETPSILTAFFGGFLSFLSPCILPLIPAYISYITGASIEELKSSNSFSFGILIHSLLFVFGFSTIFLFLGFASSLIGSFFIEKKFILEKVAGIFIIILSLHLTGILRFKFLDVEKKLNPVQSSLPFLRSFLVGFGFGFGWTPCIGPILSAILALAATSASPLKGTFLLAFYSLGLAIPFIISGLFINLFFAMFLKFKKHLRKVEIIAGLFLFALGILLLLGIFSKITFTLSL
ncbi:MAG: cytochrome c biogenesis protein CcdA [candidate division WOR-3 bacterium]